MPSTDKPPIACAVDDDSIFLSERLFSDPDVNGLPTAAEASLVRLWCWAARAHRDGDLSSEDDATIAARANWRGEPAAFLAELRAAGLLDDAKRLLRWSSKAPPEEQVTDLRGLLGPSR